MIVNHLELEYQLDIIIQINKINQI